MKQDPCYFLKLRCSDFNKRYWQTLMSNGAEGVSGNEWKEILGHAGTDEMQYSPEYVGKGA